MRPLLLLAQAADAEPTIPPLHLFWLAASVVGVALLSVCFLLYTRRFDQSQQFHIAVALIAFTLSTVSCLLFVAQVKLEANIGWATITLIGPGVLWLVSIVILTRVWRIGDAVRPVRALAPGWLAFAMWRTQQGALNYLFRGDYEQFCIREVFNNVFFRAPGRRKLSRPLVQTVFVYYPREDEKGQPLKDEKGRPVWGMVKFQRVLGATKNPPADIYHVSAPSLPGQDPQSYLFVLDAGAVDRALPRGDTQETWHPIDGGGVDCMVVAHCPEGNPPEGDYLWVDVPKYTADVADVQVTFLSTVPMRDEENFESRLWEVTHSVAGTDDGDQEVDIPVVFLKRDRRGLRSRAATAQIPDPGLEAWFKALDGLCAVGPLGDAGLEAAKKFLRGVVDCLTAATNQPAADARPSTVLNGTAFPHMCHFDEKGLRNPVMAVVQWVPTTNNNP